MPRALARKHQAAPVGNFSKTLLKSIERVAVGLKKLLSTLRMSDLPVAKRASGGACY
jgi:hypothetical protein